MLRVPPDRCTECCMRKGRHDGLVGFETYEKIQARLKGTAKAPARKDINADFPLRGFILCNDCSKPLTACWSAGQKTEISVLPLPYQGLCELSEINQARRSRR